MYCSFVYAIINIIIFNVCYWDINHQLVYSYIGPFLYHPKTTHFFKINLKQKCNCRQLILKKMVLRLLVRCPLSFNGYFTLMEDIVKEYLAGRAL